MKNAQSVFGPLNKRLFAASGKLYSAVSDANLLFFTSFPPFQTQTFFFFTSFPPPFLSLLVHIR
jgi:hypothetical protein